MAEPKNHGTGSSHWSRHRPDRRRRDDSTRPEPRDEIELRAADSQPKVMTLDMLYADIMPEDETADMMIETIRRWRREASA